MSSVSRLHSAAFFALCIKSFVLQAKKAGVEARERGYASILYAYKTMEAKYCYILYSECTHAEEGTYKEDQFVHGKVEVSALELGLPWRGGGGGKHSHNHVA